MTTTSPYITAELAKEIFITELKRLCTQFSMEAEYAGVGKRELVQQYNNCAREVNRRSGREVMILKNIKP